MRCLRAVPVCCGCSVAGLKPCGPAPMSVSECRQAKVPRVCSVAPPPETALP